MKIDDLRRARKAAADKMKACADQIAALEDGEAPDEAQIAAAHQAFDAAKAEFDAAAVKLQRAEAVEAAQAAAAIPVDELPAPGATAPSAVPAIPKDPRMKAIEVGLLVQALGRTKGDRIRAAANLDRDGFSGISAILNGTDDAAGGVTIPQAQAADLIELLRPNVVVRASGARTVPMPAGQLRHARQTAPATASYTAETARMVESEPTFDKLDMNFKKLTSLVPVSNSLLRHTSIPMAALVRDDIVRVMALREDLAFLRGDGTANTPTGIRNWALAGNWQAAVASDPATVEAALRRVVSLVQDANVALTNGGWIMRSSTLNFLSSLRNANGYFVFPSLAQGTMLLGYPVRTTSQVPDNLGTGGDETEITFADFDEIMIGDSMTISIDISQEAAFVDTGGNVVSAFQQDLTLMRAISEHDLAPAHDEAIAGLNGVGWAL